MCSSGDTSYQGAPATIENPTGPIASPADPGPIGTLRPSPEVGAINAIANAAGAPPHTQNYFSGDMGGADPTHTQMLQQNQRSANEAQARGQRGAMDSMNAVDQVMQLRKMASAQQAASIANEYSGGIGPGLTNTGAQIKPLPDSMNFNADGTYGTGGSLKPLPQSQNIIQGAYGNSDLQKSDMNSLFGPSETAAGGAAADGTAALGTALTEEELAAFEESLGYL